MEHVRKNNIKYEPPDPNQLFTKKPRVTREDIENRKREADEYRRVRGENANLKCKVWFSFRH